MRAMQGDSKRSIAGFSIVEMLVVAPIMVLVLAAFIGLIVSLTGDALLRRTSGELVYDVQGALDQIQRDGSEAIAYLQTVSTITTPQGANNDTTAFDITTNSKAIFTLHTINKSSFDASRDLVFANSGGASCANRTTHFNQNVVYFVTTSGGKDSLWRRVLEIPGQTVCAGTSPWRETTCQAGQVAAVCKTEDRLLLTASSITMSVAYLTNAASTSEYTTPQVDSNAIRVTITASRDAAGRTQSFTGSVTTEDLNL